MKALLNKDFIALKKSLILLAVLVVTIGIYSFWQGTVVILPLIFMLIPVILLGILFSSDAKSKVEDQRIAAEPIKRRTIVLSRYVFVWIIAVIGTFFALLLKFFMKDALESVPWYLIVPSMLLLITFLSLIQLPLMYKFGVEKVKGVFVFIYFIVFALFFYVGGNENRLSEYLDKATHLNLKTISLILAGVTILLNSVSFALSVTIYEKKES